MTVLLKEFCTFSLSLTVHLRIYLLNENQNGRLRYLIYRPSHSSEKFRSMADQHTVNAFS